MSIKSKLHNLRIKIREYTNPFFGPFRRRKIKDLHFTIISNNCWAGHVYRYFSVNYMSPTIGLYFFSDDYIRFCKDLKKYIEADLTFIDRKDSKHYEDHLKRNTTCPIGKINDVEIVFLHYKTEAEAYEKWNRRKQRINWNHIVVKFSQQNKCTIKDLQEFDRLPYKSKFVFTTKDYCLSSQVIWGGYTNQNEITNDTTNFSRRIDLVKFINEQKFQN